MHTPILLGQSTWPQGRIRSCSCRCFLIVVLIEAWTSCTVRPKRRCSQAENVRNLQSARSKRDTVCSNYENRLQHLYTSLDFQTIRCVDREKSLLLSWDGRYCPSAGAPRSPSWPEFVPITSAFTPRKRTLRSHRTRLPDLRERATAKL